MLLANRIHLLRRRAKMSRGLATVLTLVLTPVVLLLFAALFLGLAGPVTSPRTLLRDTWRAIFRFSVRLFSGHGLRPFTLRSVSGARF
jgi:hypothetical protein